MARTSLALFTLTFPSPELFSFRHMLSDLRLPSPQDSLDQPSLFLDRLEQSLAAIILLMAAASRISSLVSAWAWSLKHDLVAQRLTNDRLAVPAKPRRLKQEVVGPRAVRMGE